MESQIYLPKKLKVGYQKRLDTYSKKLGYVIYYDDKNKLRKETSWKGWIDTKLGVDEFENVPTEGFVLNRNVGGVKNSYYSDDVRIEKVRVYDPRGFEFEIDIPNVLTILQECTSAKGKGLEGTFVYGWVGSKLVLIPTSSHEYTKSQDFTKLQGSKVETKDLIIGASYKTKKQEDLVYLGRFDWFERKVVKGNIQLVSSKKHVFVNENALDGEEFDMTIEDYDEEEDYQKDLEDFQQEKLDKIANGENYKFIVLASMSNLAICNTETPVSNYADLLSKFNRTMNSSQPINLIAKPTKLDFTKDPRYSGHLKNIRNYFIKKGSSYVRLRFNISYLNNKLFTLDGYDFIKLESNNLTTKYEYGKRVTINGTAKELKEVEVFDLWVELANGETISIEQYI